MEDAGEAGWVRPGDVAARLGHELDRLGSLAGALQDALSPLPGIGAAMEAMQSLDLMLQSLLALSGFLAAWGPALEASDPKELETALARITLADIARRLAGVAQPAHPAPAEDDSDAFELFESDA